MSEQKASICVKMKAAVSSSEELRDGQVNQGQKKTGLSTAWHVEFKLSHQPKSGLCTDLTGSWSNRQLRKT